MFWFNFFDNKTTQLKHPFGRGINATISPDEENLFNKSQEAFEAKNPLDAYEYFFKSLENFTDDISNENIVTSREIISFFLKYIKGVQKLLGISLKRIFMQR